MKDRVEVDPDEQVVRAPRSVRKHGNSIVIAIPPQVLEAAGFELDDDVVLEADMQDGGISIRLQDDPDQEGDS